MFWHYVGIVIGALLGNLLGYWLTHRKEDKSND